MMTTRCLEPCVLAAILSLARPSATLLGPRPDGMLDLEAHAQAYSYWLHDLYHPEGHKVFEAMSKPRWA